MGKADLHIHTRDGDGLDSVEAIFDHVEAQTDLDVIAITEHDNLETALRARETWARGGYRFDFVPGVEVTTLEGPLDRALRRGAGAQPAPRRGDNRGGAAPGRRLLRAPPDELADAQHRSRHLRARVARRDGLCFDAIELASASPAARFYLDKARRLNDETLPPARRRRLRRALPSRPSAAPTPHFEGSSAARPAPRLQRRRRQRRHAAASPACARSAWHATLSLPIAGLRRDAEAARLAAHGLELRQQVRVAVKIGSSRRTTSRCRAA